MYSSPTTPGGVRLRFASRTNTCVLAIGRPIGIGLSADVILQTVDQTVVSVGPYMFHNSAHRGSSSFARSRGIDSPPQRALKPADPFHPASISARHAAGVACMTVHCESRIRARSRAGSL